MLWLIIASTLSCAYGYRLQIPSESPSKVSTSTFGPRLDQTPPVCPKLPLCPKQPECQKPPECPPPPSCPTVTVQSKAKNSTRRKTVFAVKNLQSKTGWHLAVSAEGKVYGIRAVKDVGSGWDSDAVLTITSRGSGKVQIKGLKAKLYVAMNDQGDVYAERDNKSRNTWWQQSGKGPWIRFKWLGNNKSWYLALQRNKTKKGNLTDIKQSAVQFKREEPDSADNATASEQPDIYLDNENYHNNTKYVPLWSRTGFSLAVCREWKGEPWASASIVDVYTEKLTWTMNQQFQIYRQNPVEKPLEVRIYSRFGLFVAMNHEGYVSLTDDWYTRDIEWKMVFADKKGWWVSYEWLGNNETWYLAINKKGHLRRGPDTRRSHQSAQFWPPWAQIYKRF